MHKNSGYLIIASFVFWFTVQPVQAGWIKTYCPHTVAYGNWVELTKDGGYIVTGWDVESMHYHQSVERLYVVKTDSLGDTLWTRAYDGTQESGGGRCIRNADDGGYVIIGVSGVNWNAWLLKLDSEGDTSWTRQLEGNDCYDLLKTTNGYVVTGKLSGEFDKLLLEKVDFEGNELWTRIYGEDSSQQWGYSVQETPDGGYLVTGAGPETGLWILRTDSEGDTLWSKLYKFGDPLTRDEGHCIEPTSDGCFIITGAVDYKVASYGVLLLMKIDSLGDTLWTKMYDYGGKVENGKSVKQTPDGGYIVLVQKDYSISGTGYIWLLKTDSAGDTLWTRTYGRKPYQDRGDCIQLTPDGGYIITGLTSTFSSDSIDRSKQVLLMKLDSLGLLGVAEPPSETPATHLEIISPIGPTVTLRYSNCPNGLRASVYDAGGRKVDELYAPTQSGALSWGSHQSPGVYFIVANTGSRQVSKVVLVR